MSRFQSCPVCCRSVAISLINDHLDEHLNKDQSTGTPPRKRPKLAVSRHIERKESDAGTRSGLHAPALIRKPAAAPLAVVQRSKGSTKQALSDEELLSCTPCEVVRSFLPAALADQVLHELLKDSEVLWSPAAAAFTSPFSLPR